MTMIKEVLSGQGVANALNGHRVKSTTFIEGTASGYEVINITFEDDVILQLVEGDDTHGIQAILLRPRR